MHLAREKLRYVTSFAPWMIRALVLLGFLSELGLQAFARPHESPRAEISRLLHVDIAQSACHAVRQDAHPGAHNQQSTGHHDHQSCALCPLISLAALLIFAITAFIFQSFSMRMRHRLVVFARGPPVSFYPRPRGRAPPCFA